MAFALPVLGAVAQIVLGFYGFWLVWRFLLPYLPGPKDSRDRVAPFVGYFTDPFVNPVAERLHVRRDWSRGCGSSSSPLPL